MRLTAPKEGYLEASIRGGLWLFLTFRRLSGNLGIAAGFAMADDANRSKAAPAIGGNPSSAELIDAGGAAGSWRLVRRTTATAETGEAAILHTVDIERSDPRSAGRMLRCGRLPGDATSLVTGPWRTARELEIKVADGRAPIDGVVA